MTADWVYVFGIVAGDPGPMPPGPLGTPRYEPVSTAGDTVGLLVADVGDERWHALSEDDAEWIVPRVVHHDGVLCSVVGTAVVPLRFPTVFPDLDQARRAVADQVDQLVAHLHRFTGLHERTVKLGRTRRSDRPRSGADYLRARRAELEDPGAVWSDAIDAIRDVTAGVHVREQTPRSLTLAVLVAEDSVDALAELAPTLADTNDISAPLPPYHFVDSDLTAEAIPEAAAAR